MENKDQNDIEPTKVKFSMEMARQEFEQVWHTQPAGGTTKEQAEMFFKNVNQDEFIICKKVGQRYMVPFLPQTCATMYITNYGNVICWQPHPKNLDEFHFCYMRCGKKLDSSTFDLFRDCNIQDVEDYLQLFIN
jgi:hypothetical protein